MTASAGHEDDVVDTLRFVDASHEGHRMRGRSLAVFGGSSGIGFATAAMAVQECADHVFLVAQNPRQLESAARVLRGVRSSSSCHSSNHATIVTLRANVSDRRQVAAAFRAMGVVLGDPQQLHTVVNTAGIAGFIGTSLADVPDDIFRSKFDPIQNNLYGALHTTAEALRFWNLTDANDTDDDADRPPHSIVHLSSENGLSPCPGCALYGASKSGIISLVRSVGAYYAAAGNQLKINAIAPGLVDTPLTWNQLRGSRISADGQSLLPPRGAPLQPWQCVSGATGRVLSDGTCPGGGTGEGCPCADERARDPRLPLKYGDHLWPAIDPRDVGDLALFLASDASLGMTGVTVVIDNNHSAVANEVGLLTTRSLRSCPTSTIDLCSPFAVPVTEATAVGGQTLLMLMLALSHALAVFLGLRLGRK